MAKRTTLTAREFSGMTDIPSLEQSLSVPYFRCHGEGPS